MNIETRIIPRFVPDMQMCPALLHSLFVLSACSIVKLLPAYIMNETRGAKRLHLLTGMMRDVSEFEEEAVHIEVYLGGEWKRRVMVLPKWQIAIMRERGIYHMTDDDKEEIQVRLAPERRARARRARR